MDHEHLHSPYSLSLDVFLRLCSFVVAFSKLICIYTYFLSYTGVIYFQLQTFNFAIMVNLILTHIYNT